MWELSCKLLVEKIITTILSGGQTNAMEKVTTVRRTLLMTVFR